MTPVSLEPMAPGSRVKHSTTEPLHSLQRCLSDDSICMVRISVAAIRCLSGILDLRGEGCI